MSFAFEVIFVKIYSLAVLLLFEREKKLVVKQEQDGRFFLTKGQKDLIDKKKKDYSTLFIRYSFSTSKLVSSSLLVVSQSSN